MALVLLLACASAIGRIYVDQNTSVFRDEYNRTLLWHGTNKVNKGAPYYPTITEADRDLMVSMGTKVVRVGVMMPGVFPTRGKLPNATYLDETQRIIDFLWARGIYSILDLHQDVLSHVICGEGSPDWMLNTSTLDSLPFPEPLVLNGSKPDPKTGGWEPGFSCSAQGPLKFIGWSEFYMTDGKPCNS
jgi:endoglycosylceramidase